MYTKVDLHTHSFYSDGALAPESVVTLAESAGVQLLALTDHDTLAGISAAKHACQALDLISGVEISCSHAQETIHIVALGINIHHQGLNNLLERNQAIRLHRAKQIGEILVKMGVRDVSTMIYTVTKRGIIGRVHFAKLLIEQGYAKDMQSAFKQFLSRGKPAYVPANWPDMQEVISVIKQSGGKSVLAHPHRYRLSMSKLIGLIEAFHQYKGDALEIVPDAAHDRIMRCIINQCEQKDLDISLGSDFHDPDLPHHKLGVELRAEDQDRYVWRHWQGQKV